MSEISEYELFKQIEAQNKRRTPYNFYDKDELIDTILENEDEIERLNNVLIELVKWLHSEIERLDKMQDTYDKHGKKKDPNIIYISGAYIEVLDKLQELTEDKQ